MTRWACANIVTMHDGGAYGQGLAAYVADTFTAMGGTVLGTEAITPGETDYSAPLAAISALGPELIYFGGYDADAAVLGVADGRRRSVGRTLLWV